MIGVFSFCGHWVDTYRSGCCEHGAFELCLPSLGFCYQKGLLRSENTHRTPILGWPWGEHHRTCTVQTLHFVWEQLTHGLTDQHRFRSFVYVFGVDVDVEYGEQAHYYVGHDQPTGATSHPCLEVIGPIGVADEWSVLWRHWLSLPQLSTEVGRIGQAEDYGEPEYGACDHVCVLPVMYAVYIYQTVPRGGTIPNPPG